jgi:hypothetical protein
MRQPLDLRRQRNTHLDCKDEMQPEVVHVDDADREGPRPT